MLSKLTIENYALIQKSEIEFCPGFTVITGETGAGKSIMLDALSLLMGARADMKKMGDRNKKTFIEAVFIDPDFSLQKLLFENNLDWDENELVLRREISSSGKSRCFVNDTPVNLSFLAELSPLLIDIHSQHSNSLLLDSRQQLSIIDKYSDIEDVIVDYRQIFNKYLKLRTEIKRSKEQIKANKENRDFIIFRLEQLDKLKPKKGELSQLEKEFEILNDADRLKSQLSEAYDILDTRQDSALKQLKRATENLGGINLSIFSNSEENLISRLESLKIELKDIAETIGNYIERIESNPERLEKLQTRIHRIEEAIKRFKVADNDQLVNLYIALKNEMNEIDDVNTDLSNLEKELKLLGVKLKSQAERLSEAREKSAIEFATQLKKKIAPLGLPNINFSVNILKGKLSADGQDTVTFFCSFNKNHKLQPISEIASGGEISRVMLGIKSLMAEKMKLPTVIFDEIDSGVSGEIAHKMGYMMKEMSENMQIITVTHLPQVAAAGESHLKVYKADMNEKTVSNIRSLNSDERLKEIAGMLSGSEINEAALNNAKILLQ